MSDIKQKAREMFDERNKEHWGIKSVGAFDIKCFIDEIIDLAIAERNKKIVEMIEKQINPFSANKENPIEHIHKNMGYSKAQDDIINLITNSNK